MLAENNKHKKVEYIEEDPFVALATRDANIAKAKSEQRGSASKQQQTSADSLEQNSALTLSESAVARLRELRKEEGDAELTLRIRIYSGGCSGYRSEFSIDKVRRNNDLEIQQDGVRVLIDKLSAHTLGKSELGFTKDIIGENFNLRIEKAHNACGCGVSFAL